MVSYCLVIQPAPRINLLSLMGLGKNVFGIYRLIVILIQLYCIFLIIIYSSEFFPHIFLSLAGTCDINVVLTLQLSEEEASKVVLDAAEYSDSKWVHASELREGSSIYHPALVHSARALAASSAARVLRNAVAAGGTDADIAALARELCALTAPPPKGRSEYAVRNEELQYEGAVLVQHH